MGTLMKLGSLTTPAQRNENHRLVRVVFSNADLVDSNIMGLERSMYFASGSSPVHAESPTEEIIYFPDPLDVRPNWDVTQTVNLP